MTRPVVLGQVDEAERDVATRAGTGVPELHDADGLVPGHGGERQPKDARTAGAHAVARLLPNRLRTAGVSTTTAELTGTSEPDAPGARATSPGCGPCRRTNLARARSPPGGRAPG